jgi:hypothetical protein
MAINATQMHDFEKALDCVNKSLLLKHESYGGSKKKPKTIVETEKYRDLILNGINGFYDN